MSYLVAFAAGMLIALSLCHILPEMVEQYAAWYKKQHAAHEAAEAAAAKKKATSNTTNSGRRLFRGLAEEEHAHEESPTFPVI